jgi:aminoglycoside phosphotransferase (APT) family kinase protein
VNGSPFYVMSFVDGIIVRDAEVGRRLTSPETRAVMGISLVDVLAELHGIDPDAVGLGDLGRKEGYIERQLKRWSTQFEASTTRDLPVVKQVHRRLAAAVPEQGPAAIAHGDYRLDNCICKPEGSLAAVLDWELCTLGDAMADLGMLIITWAQEGDTRTARPDAATQLPGFPTRDEVVARYVERTGRDVSDLPYYCAFQYWRLACISEGVYARYAAGAMGDQRDVDVDALAQGTPRLAALAAEELDRR